MRDEGKDWVQLELYDEHGRQGRVRVLRHTLLIYARELLSAGIRS